MFPVKPKTLAINWGHPITKGLVFCQPLFECGGIIPQDLVSKNKAVAFTNTPLWHRGILSSMVFFNGLATTGPYITTNSPPAVRNTHQRTYCAMIYKTGTPAATSGRVIQEGDGNADGLCFTDNINLMVLFSKAWSGTAPSWRWPLPPVNVLTFYIVTYDSSNVANVPQLWANGIKQVLNTSVQPTGTLTFLDSHITIGNINDGVNVGNRTYNGYISDVCKWNRILTDKEVQELSVDPWMMYRRSSFKKKLLTGQPI